MQGSLTGREGSEQLLAKIYMETGMGKIPKAYLQKLVGENPNSGSKNSHHRKN